MRTYALCQCILGVVFLFFPSSSPFPSAILTIISSLNLAMGSYVLGQLHWASREGR